MKQLVNLLLTSAFVFFAFVASSQHITRNPKVEESSVPYVTITRVEITQQHTAFYFRFVDNSKPTQFRFPFPNRGQQSTSRIWIDPNTRLYKPGDVNTKFRFLRAEGIPTNPQQRTVEEGEVVEFVTYFEPLPPGLEVIDLYEGRSTQNTTAWNFYGIHINNPVAQKQPTRPEPIAVEAVPDPQPIVTTPVYKPTVLAMTGTILDATTGKAIRGRIRYIEEGDSLMVGTTTGRYKIALTPERSYTFVVASKGYIEQTWTLSDTVGIDFQKNFELKPITSGATFTLERIYFETSKFALLKESFNQLDEFVEMMNENPTIHIRVDGHSDNLGDFDKNVELSENRAKAVKDYLISKGIAPERVEAKGFGPTRPVSTGTSEAERQKNRRVEITITKS